MAKKMSFDKNKITPVVSEIIDSVIPTHIQSNYPKFIEFVQVFFSFLEEGNKSGLYLNSISEQKNNLSEDSPFLSLIEKEIGLFVPQKYVADPAVFYNRIVDLWKSKGSEESIRTFFRLFLNKEVDFYYPWSDVLIVSDGRWIRNHKIRVLSKTGFGNPLDLEGKSIFQINSGATARVEKVEAKVYGGTLKIYEVTLIRETITGTFSINNDIVSVDNLITATVRETVNGIKINSGGSGYLPGDRIYASNLNQRSILAYVNEITPEGSIKTIKIEDYGALLTSDSPILLIESKNGQDAVLELLFGALVIEDGFYQGTSGQLSESNVLQDSQYYQKFSYEIIVNSPINIWKDVFRRSIHPSGLKVFSNFLVEKEIDQKIKKATDLLTKEVPRETNFIESLSIQSDLFITKQDYVTKRATGSFGNYFEEQYLILNTSYVDINKNEGFYFKEDYIGESLFFVEDSEGSNSFNTDYLETGLFTCKWDELFAVKSESKIDNTKLHLDLEVKKVPSVKIEKIIESFIVNVDPHLRKIFFRRNFDIESKIENISTSIVTVSGRILRKIINQITISSISNISTDVENELFERVKIQDSISFQSQDYVNNYKNIASVYFAEEYTSETYIFNLDGVFFNEYYVGKDYKDDSLPNYEFSSHAILDNTFGVNDINISIEKSNLVPFTKDKTLENPDLQIFESLPIETKSFLSGQDYVNNYDRLNSYFANTFEDTDYFSEIYFRDIERYSSNVDGPYAGSQSESNSSIKGLEYLHDDIIENSEDNINKAIKNKINIIPSERLGILRYHKDISSEIQSVSYIQSTLLTRFVESIEIKSSIHDEVKTILPRSIHNTNIKSKIKSEVNVNIEPIYNLSDEVKSSTKVSVFGQDYTNEFSSLGKFYQEENYFLEEYSTDRQDHYFSDQYIFTPYFEELFTRDDYCLDESDTYVGYKYDLTELVQEESFLETTENI